MLLEKRVSIVATGPGKNRTGPTAVVQPLNEASAPLPPRHVNPIVLILVAAVVGGVVAAGVTVTYHIRMQRIEQRRAEKQRLADELRARPNPCATRAPPPCRPTRPTTRARTTSPLAPRHLHHPHAITPTPVRLSLLGSGSSGNVAYIEAGKGTRTRVLVDAGLSKSEIVARLHGAHRRGRAVDAGPDRRGPGHPRSQRPRRLRRRARAAALRHRRHAPGAARSRRRWCCAGEPFTVGALRGDAGAAAARRRRDGRLRRSSDGASRVGILTDCGHDAPEVAQAYAGCDVLVLETNHDVTMLRYGPYPPSLKRRVGGRLGHLSNDQAASLLKHDAAGGAAAEAGDRRAPVAGQQPRRSWPSARSTACSAARGRVLVATSRAARPSSPSRAAACARALAQRAAQLSTFPSLPQTSETSA